MCGFGEPSGGCRRPPAIGCHGMVGASLVLVIDPFDILASKAHIFCNQVQAGLVVAKVWAVDIVLRQILNFMVQHI